MGEMYFDSGIRCITDCVMRRKKDVLINRHLAIDGKLCSVAYFFGELK